MLRVDGICEGENCTFQVAIGKAAQEKHRFRAGMELSGLAIPVPDPCQRHGRGRQVRLEAAGFYKASGLKILKDAEGDPRMVHRSMGNRPTWIFTAAVDICVWTPEPMTPSALTAFGAAGCRWK